MGTVTVAKAKIQCTTTRKNVERGEAAFNNFDDSSNERVNVRFRQKSPPGLVKLALLRGARFSYKGSTVCLLREIRDAE